MESESAVRWTRTHVQPTGELEVVRVRPWATVARVPVANGCVWLKVCAAVQAFEPRLSADLSARWVDRVGEVLAHDDARGFLLFADAGLPIRERTDASELLLRALPSYAELQRGETRFADEHVGHGVPDLRLATLPPRYAELLEATLPIDDAEHARLRAFAPRLATLCAELASCAIPETVQHDDLHGGNVFAADDDVRILDWGDASIAHPFLSLVVPFRFLEELDGLPPGDHAYTRLRDAYLEPWGAGLEEAFALAIRVGAFAHTIAWLRQRDALPEADLPAFDEWFAVVLRHALRRIPA